MAKKIIKAHMKQRQDTKAGWAELNPVLLDGELGFVTDDPHLYKKGDGVTAWNGLPFRGFDGTIVQELGTSQNAVMSQKAVSDKFEEIESKLNKPGGIDQSELEKKQDRLVSGENIKTINGMTLLGKGNILIPIYSPPGMPDTGAPSQDVEGFIPLSRDFSDDFNNDFAR